MTVPFTGGGALAQSVSRATAPVVARLIAQLGSDVAIYRATETRGSDNRTMKVWEPVAIAPTPRMVIGKTSIARLDRAWGAERNVRAEGMAPYTLDLRDGDGVKVSAGPYTGERFVVAAQTEDAVGGVRVAGLTPTREVF